MERFEELITGRTFAGNGTIDSIGDLEKGAFERGLPAKGETAICSVNHGVRNQISPNRPTSEQGQLNNTPPLILLIDDEAPFRSVIKQVLQNAGYDVVEAADGAEGIRYFHEKPADMIITDIIMPEKEGIETIIELKEAYPAVKMIAMSGGGWYGTDIDFDMAKKLGAHTLDKPFALQELLDVVNELLN
ncbi:MAG: response regulator [Desulfobacterales bacterium]